MLEQQTNPQQGESRPRTDWDIGKAMSGFFPGEQELEAEGAPEEGTVPEDEVAEDVEASGGEDAEPEAEETSEDKFTPLPLKVGGKEIVVESKEEAIALAQKGMHYTQEMQKLRERETQLASEHEQARTNLRQQEEQYTTALKTLHSVYGHVLGQGAPDWASDEMQKLKAERPADYLALREQWDQMGAIRGEIERIEAEQKTEQQKKWQGWVAEQRTALADKKPEWVDPTRRQQDWAMIQQYGSEQGLTDEEFANLYDHRFWLILHDAARYRQAQAAGKKAKPAATKTVEPGSGKGVNQGNRRLGQEREKLRTTGDVRAAGQILQDLMTRKR